GNAWDLTFRVSSKILRKISAFRCRALVPLQCAHEKLGKEGILKPERSSISKRAGLLDLSRHPPSKKGFRIRSFSPRTNADRLNRCGRSLLITVYRMPAQCRL